MPRTVCRESSTLPSPPKGRWTPRGRGRFCNHRDELPMPEGDDPYMAQYEMAPNGEGSAKLELRCRDFLADIKGPSVLVTHGITSRVIRSIVAGPDAISVASVHGGQGCVYHLKDGVQNSFTRKMSGVRASHHPPYPLDLKRSALQAK